MRDTLWPLGALMLYVCVVLFFVHLSFGHRDACVRIGLVQSLILTGMYVVRTIEKRRGLQ